MPFYFWGHLLNIPIIAFSIRKESIIFYFQDNRLFSYVGVAGFEPTTPCSQSRCANRTALHPDAVEYLSKAMQR